MKITIWGCRGSITSPGKETLRYGGESTCLEILTDEKETIVIDAGSGIRKLGYKMVKDTSLAKFSMLLTHAHWDHLAGFPFFRPAFFSRFSITLCGGQAPRISLMNYLRHQMEAPYFPVDMTAMHATFTEGCTCGCAECNHTIPGIEGAHRCDSIPLNHPNGGFGYKLTGKLGKVFVFLTDNELQYRHETGQNREDYVLFCKNADLLFHDAHYTEEEYRKTKTWGHSTYKDAVDLAIDAGVKRLGLFHHDPDRTDEQIDRQVEWCKDYIRDRGSNLECFACAEGDNYYV
jgi:phosphoribosyl 1,2-cyclic phosphodiesterase